MDEIKNILPGGILILAVIVISVRFYSPDSGREIGERTAVLGFSNRQVSVDSLEDDVLPADGVPLPAVWGDLGPRLVAAGVIDVDKLRSVYESRGDLPAEFEELLTDRDVGRLKMTRENADYLLNLFWAVGLANKNPILDFGEISNQAGGGAGNFASTGGWTVSRGEPMDHFSRHALLALTPAEQALVEKVSKGIYRPCCGNSVHFPDCNHGMAMLGLLELMASQGASEEEMWQTALAVNSFWFPDTYLTLAKYMEGRGVKWRDVDPAQILGAEYSSSRGYAKIAAEVANQSRVQKGQSCGV